MRRDACDGTASCAWKPRSSTLASTIKEARASLSEPSRPFTPAETGRHLFRHPSSSISGFERSSSDMNAAAASRPASSFRIGSSQFVSGSVSSIRPSYESEGAEVLQLIEPPPPPPGNHRVPAAAAEAPKKGRHEQPLEPSWWTETEVLLDELRPDAPLDLLVQTCDALLERLRPPSGPDGPEGAASPSASESTRRRKRILSAAGGLMDRREAPLLLRLCCLILGATSEGGAQLGACKLLFKLSKSESNDRRFRELGLLPLLLAVLGPPDAGRHQAAAVQPASEALLYAAGALKNTSADSANQKALISLGAVAVFAHAIRLQTERVARAPPTPRDGARDASVRPVHLLVQLTATLRNVAVSGSSRKQFVSSGCVEELCSLLRVVPNNAELCLNVSRVLAKLSLHEEVRSRIDAHPENLTAMLHALNLHAADRPLLIRFCFILGNLSASHEVNREVIAKLALPLLLRLLKEHAAAAAQAHAAAAAAAAPSPAAPASSTCSVGTQASHEADAADPAAGPTADPAADATASRGEDGATRRQMMPPRPPPPASAGGSTASAAEGGGTTGQPAGGGSAREGGGEGAERIDVLVKLVRLLAHLAITPSIGEAIAVSSESIVLLRLLQAISMDKEEELELNVVSAITNLSYYIIDGSHLLQCHQELAAALVPVLTFPNPEGMVEAARALGNLSRLPEARRAICSVRVHEALVLLLDHSMCAVSEAACGALINLAADPETRAVLLDCGAASRLADLLLTLLSPPVAASGAPPEPTPADVGAALLATKTLCNLCCGCSTNPLDGGLTTELEQRLNGGAVPSSWRSLSHDVSGVLAEWPQAATLLLGLLARLPAGEQPSFGDDDEYEESPLEELPIP